MGYKLIIQILIILAAISTICICAIKPKMHKPVMVYNSDIEVVTDYSSVKIEENNIPIMVQNAEVQSADKQKSSIVNTPVLSNNIKPANPITNTKNINFNSNNNLLNKKTNIQNTKITNNNINNSKNNISVSKQNIVNNNISTQNPQIDINKIVENNKKIVQQPKENHPVKPIQSNENLTKPQALNLNTSANTKNPNLEVNNNQQSTVLSAQEEEIAWNKWRSNLNNQIMRDSKLPTMPNGIIFRYKFNVDKYGKISNVQTWSTTQSYTPYAIQFIAPVIRSYQGHAILNFPTGSNRVSTEVTGAWKISSNEKLSTPSDYNDIEKIRK